MSQMQQRMRILGLCGAIALLFKSQAAYAHHPFGGTTPTTAFTGFLSGLGHPVIGVDHFAVVVATGLLAALYGRRGLVIPLAFIITTMLGTGLHLQAMDLPFAETAIAVSVLSVGVLLAIPQRLQWLAVAAIAALAGIFHGYAYGEAIVGAEMTPLVAYLSGFATIQGAIALSVALTAQQLWQNLDTTKALPLRFAGFTLAGVGLAFLSSAVLG
ncbi:HupE/UreJ family protein [Spirulina major]|uniref:HupE/UreJ family protein n=1 Tax=Spirulina major TaxID=270636 RepID=UPI000934B4A5|nr:HupE/UreJ family protein [Spirulina major]